LGAEGFFNDSGAIRAAGSLFHGQAFAHDVPEPRFALPLLRFPINAVHDIKS
jgi:hypothetical protein